jgi:serine/threonine protein kinase
MRFACCHKAANKLWLFCEYIAGGTLKEALAVRALSSEELLLVSWSVLQALDVLHARNLVHRDVKVRCKSVERNV